MKKIGLICATLTISTSLSAAPADRVAQLSSPERSEQQKYDIGIPHEELQERMKRFVRSFYLSGDDLSAEEIRVLYAPRVRYFGNRTVRIDELVRDKLSYYRRWPDRAYELDLATFQVWQTDNAQRVIVEFEYDFAARGRQRVSRGRGYAYLSIDFSVPDGKIIAERGKVLRRWR